MKVFILSLSLVLFGAMAWAQCACNQTITVTDVTCTTPHDCISTTGCTSISFTASCSGEYDFGVALTCGAGLDCSDFNACANVYEGTTFIENCHDNPCSQCSRTCTVCLHAGHNYTLYVCLKPCADDGDCPVTGMCTATGTIKYCGSGATSCQ